MADLRGDEATVQHLSRLGRSPVTPDQAIAIGVQINARNYIETAAAVSYVETFELFSLAAMSALEFRRIHCPAPEPAPGPFQRPGSVASHHSNVSLSRGGHVPGIRHVSGATCDHSVTDAVSTLCHGYPDCSFPASPMTLGGNCSNQNSQSIY